MPMFSVINTASRIENNHDNDNNNNINNNNNSNKDIEITCTHGYVSETYLMNKTFNPCILGIFSMKKLFAKMIMQHSYC